MDFPSYDNVKSFFNMKLWTKEMVGDAVKCAKITAEQYQEITGEEYAA